MECRYDSSLLTTSGIYVEEGAQRSEVVDDLKETVFSRHNSADARMNLQTVTTCAKPAQTQARQNHSTVEE